MKSTPILALSQSLSLWLLAVPGGASAQCVDQMHDPGMDHAAMYGAAVLTEPGQGAVAAIEEIVAMLAADPAAVMRIRGPGFFGLMAAGDHHLRHHLGMATGEPVH